MNQLAPSEKARLFIGVDGGGTGCRARIEDAEGRVLGTGIAGPAAVRLGIDRCVAALESACRAAAQEAGLTTEALAVMDAGVGLAGIGRKAALEAFMARPHPFRSVMSWHALSPSTPRAKGAPLRALGDCRLSAAEKVAVMPRKRKKASRSEH